jgi:hypothetical protein
MVQDESPVPGSSTECRRCRHYYITWDKKFPYGCRAAGFKTARTPSDDMFTVSGKPCLAFEKKAAEGRNNRDI